MLMWFTGIRDNPSKHEVHLKDIYKLISSIKENTKCLHDNDQFVTDVSGNDLCLFWESYKTRKYTLWKKA
jgi:hypothetical protein